MINADVLPGPGAQGVCRFNASSTRTLAGPEQEAAAAAFLSGASAAFPRAILSPGWTTGGEGLRYSAGDVDAMLRVCSAAVEAAVAPSDSPLVFTFPVRATCVRPSWEQLSRLLAAGAVAGAAGTTLTVWSNVPLPEAEWAWLREHLDPGLTFYDIKLA
jgi:hypothetical protein